MSIILCCFFFDFTSIILAFKAAQFRIPIYEQMTFVARVMDTQFKGQWVENTCLSSFNPNMGGYFGGMF